MKNIKDIKIRDQELLNNPLYNISVVHPVIHKKIGMKIKMIVLLEIMNVIYKIKTTVLTIMTDIEITTDTESIVENIHKIIIDLILNKDTAIDLEVPTHLDLDSTIITKEELHPDLHIDHHKK